MNDFMKSFYGGSPNIKPFRKSERKSKREIPDTFTPPVSMTKGQASTPVITLYGDVDKASVSPRADQLWRNK